MVNKTIFFIIIMLIVPCSLFAEEPFTGKDLKRLLSESEQEHLEHSKELKSNRLHELLLPSEAEAAGDGRPEKDNGLELPPPYEGDTSSKEGKGDEKYNFFKGPKDSLSGSLDDGTPSSSDPEPKDLPDEDMPKYEGTTPKQKEIKKEKPAPKAVKAKVDHDRYVPPSWSFLNGKKAAPIHSSQAEKQGGPYFGIWMGTEFRAELVRTTTNIDPDWAEFIVTDDVFGDFKTLHKGSKLYANKKVSKSSNRIYFNILKGITPEGETFKMNATVTDVSSNRLSGLTGTITTDQNLIKRSFGEGALAAGREFINQTVPDDVVGTATSAAAITALSEKEQEKDATLGEPTFVIFVNPQDVFIRTNDTF